jgi:hypothetical protein
MITKAQARSLAIRYHAYMEARMADDYMGILVWGPMLEETQQQIDYVMVKNITEAVQFARLQVKQAA